MTNRSEVHSAVTSAVYSKAFNLIAVCVLLLLEGFFRCATGESALTVLPAWFVRGDGRILISFVGGLAAVGFALTSASVARSVYVAHTGQSDVYIYLGDELRRGFHAVPDGGPPWHPVFVPRFIAAVSSPNLTFHGVYRRMLLMRDAEGNLTPAEVLRTGRVVLAVLLELLALAVSVMCAITIAGMFNRQFPGKLQLPEAFAALRMPGEMLALFAGAVLLLNVIALACIAYRLRHVKHNVRDMAFALPAAVSKNRALLSGQVMAAENTSGTGDDDRRFYRQYAIRFEGRDFPLPVYLNWSARRISDNDLAVGSARLRKDLRREREYNERLFAHLDDAMGSGTAVEFRVTKYDLEIVPVDPAGGELPPEAEAE